MLEGVVHLGDNLTPIDVWQGLHANARAWAEVPYGAAQAQDRILIDGTDLGVLKVLGGYPADRWAALCGSVGWTAYGAAGLSWCEDATLPAVCKAWEQVATPLLPIPERERPARLVNQAILPQDRQLSKMIEATTPSATGLCIVIAASDLPIEFDLPFDALKNAPPQIAAFLKRELEARPSADPKSGEVQAIWQQRIDKAAMNARS